jgi:predicted amidohydrolase YtcJ
MLTPVDRPLHMLGLGMSIGTPPGGITADVVILSANPMKVDPATIKDIRVLETIKEGRTVFTSSSQVEK